MTGSPSRPRQAQVATSFSVRELAEALLDQRQSAGNKLKAIQRLNEHLTASESAESLLNKLQQLNARQLVPPIVELFHAQPVHPCRVIAFRALSLFSHTRDMHQSALDVLVPIFTKFLTLDDERGALYAELSIDSLHALSSSSPAVLLMTRHGAMQAVINLLRQQDTREWLWRLPCLELISALLTTKIGRVEAQSGELHTLLVNLAAGNTSEFAQDEIWRIKSLTKEVEVWRQHGI